MDQTASVVSNAAMAKIKARDLCGKKEEEELLKQLDDLKVFQQRKAKVTGGVTSKLSANPSPVSSLALASLKRKTSGNSARARNTSLQT